MDFLPETMMDFIPKMMDFIPKMMDFIPKMMGRHTSNDEHLQWRAQGSWVCPAASAQGLRIAI